ncbi:MAG: SIMPL domain-containing protein [Patescibacteria group bacterium]|nr:SIMPL domain-containing protein [Patescibacteria group bacterium]
MNLLPKWLVNALGGLLVAFVALLVVQKGIDLNNVIKNQKPANTISVSADGKIEATPDLATVNIGVMSQGTTATDVKDQNNTKINKVIDFIKAQGVDSKDITTSQFSFYPQQDWQSGIARIVGYQGNQTVTVKVHGIDKSQDVLEKVLDGAVNNGANEVNGVSLSIENPDALQQQAQQQAIANAKQKAQALAQSAGLTLGKVVSVSETGSTPAPMPYALNSVMGMGGAAKSVAPDIQTGSQEIFETMTVTFEVK